MTGALGNVIRRHDYRPFGQDLSGVNGRGPKYGNFENVKRFTGKERDAETGLDYFGARYMSAAQGRFTSPDPNGAGASIFDPMSWNAYLYVNNRPLTHVDPDGDIPIPVITGAVGAGVGALVGGGAEAFSQWSRTGTISWGKVGTAALGGGIAGGVAGATFGVGTAAGVAVTTTQSLVVNASSSVVGGIAQRRLNESLGLDQGVDGETELANIGIDAASGVVGGIIGASIADKFFPIPNIRREVAILQHAHRRSTRPAKIDSFVRAAEGKAFVNSVVGGVSGGLKSEGIKYFWSWWNPQPVKAASEPKPKVESRVTCYQGPGDPACPN